MAKPTISGHWIVGEVTNLASGSAGGFWFAVLEM